MNYACNTLAIVFAEMLCAPLVARMGALKRLPVVGKDLLEDAPVPRGYCNHPVAPSGGDTIVTVQRFYHGLPASSTPHRPVYSHPHPPLSSLSHGDFWDRENAFSYTIKISEDGPIVVFKDGVALTAIE